MDGIVGAKRMSAGAVGRPREKPVTDGMDIDRAPKALQVIQRSAKLRRGQASPLAHPSESRGRLDMRDRRAPDAVRVPVGTLGLLGSWLIDEQLDESAGIEVKAQRRPSET